MKMLVEVGELKMQLLVHTTKFKERNERKGNKICYYGGEVGTFKI